MRNNNYDNREALTSLTKDELMSIANNLGIHVSKKHNMNEIIEMLNKYTSEDSIE